jgi:gluconolactonase
MVHPNDGAIWFTDPGYGALMNYEGKRYNTDNVQPFIKEAVYRIDAQSGKVTKITDEPFKPNGMCFSADYNGCSPHRPNPVPSLSDGNF